MVKLQFVENVAFVCIWRPVYTMARYHAGYVIPNPFTVAMAVLLAMDR